MSQQNNDQLERLKRIRQAQLNARDPGDSIIRNYDWKQHAAKKQPRRRPFPLSEWDHLPRRIKGLLMGLAFGLVLAIIMRITFLTPEYELLMIVPMLLGMIAGFVLGSIFEEKLIP